MPSYEQTRRMPEFESVDDERRHIRQRMAAAFRQFAELGFDEGIAGHLTARDPGEPDTFWVNPFSMSFAHIKASDMIRVDHDGNVVDGDWPVNAAAFAIHSRLHKARPDVHAAAHTHSRYGRAFSTLGKLLDPLTQDSCAFYEDHSLFDDYTGVVLSSEEGDRIAKALGTTKAVILRNHGLLTVGHSVDSCAWWYITMDRSCHVQLMAEAAGTTVPIEHMHAKLTHTQVGNEGLGRLSFQPIFDFMVSKYPELLD